MPGGERGGYQRVRISIEAGALSLHSAAVAAVKAAVDLDRFLSHRWMVSNGWALAYRQYSKDYISVEDKARAGKVNSCTQAHAHTIARRNSRLRAPCSAPPSHRRACGKASFKPLGIGARTTARLSPRIARARRRCRCPRLWRHRGRRRRRRRLRRRPLSRRRSLRLRRLLRA